MATHETPHFPTKKNFLSSSRTQKGPWCLILYTSPTLSPVSVHDPSCLIIVTALGRTSLVLAQVWSARLVCQKTDVIYHKTTLTKAFVIKHSSLLLSASKEDLRHKTEVLWEGGLELLLLLDLIPFICIFCVWPLFSSSIPPPLYILYWATLLLKLLSKKL